MDEFPQDYEVFDLGDVTLQHGATPISRLPKVLLGDRFPAALLRCRVLIAADHVAHRPHPDEVAVAARATLGFNGDDRAALTASKALSSSRAAVR